MYNPTLPNRFLGFQLDLVLQVMNPTKNAVEGIAAIMRVFKVDEDTATELLDAAIAYAVGE